MWGAPRFLGALGFAALLALAPIARAQEDPLAQALEPYRRGQVREAITALQTLVESPVDRDTLAQAHLYLGVLHAALGDDLSARRDFELALAIDPALPPPPELGPSLRRAFDEARAAVGEGAQLSLDAPEHATASEPLRVEIETRGAPAGLVAAHRLRVVPEEGEPFVLRREGAGRVELSVPATALRAPGVRLEAEALTLHGGVVLSVSRALPVSLAPAEEAVTSAVSTPTAEREVPASTSLLEEPWLWIVVGAVVVGAGVGIGLGVGLSDRQPGFDLGAPMVVD